MKNSRQILVPVFLILFLSLMLVGCLPDRIEDPVPVETPPQGPPDDPPPPPPPPPQSGTSLAGNTLSLESIAENVLSGVYGRELRSILATEVAACINEMNEKSLLSVNIQNACVGIDIIGAEGTGIAYNDSYLAEDIIAGDYGRTARLNLHSFIRSFENDTKLK